jgi:hypothetical protein
MEINKLKEKLKYLESVGSVARSKAYKGKGLPYIQKNKLL